MRPLRCLAIVNRGDAAVRCLRAVKALRAQEGIPLRAIALYTDVDRDAPFVRHADAAIRLPAAPGGEVAAYLDHDLLLDAITRAGADAVWPGWGFVAEDPVFVERVEAAGLRFLGPSPAAMRALGDKIAAKRLAESAGVPVTPWSDGVVADEAEAAAVAERIGYPVVVKASAGGGGRGIRVVTRAVDMPGAFRSASAEARSAFGDGRLFVEQRVMGGRHIEVQIAGDVHGHLVAFGARDCSVQRRHQKVIEEAPPPGLAPALLAQLQAAALRLAGAVGYVGVGTVEFLVAGETPHFLEMNPRLQVEHGITETITGVDLVQLQIRIARDECLDGITVVERGVAIEARVCAEDPHAGFLPSPGIVARFDPALGPGIRIDTGAVVGTYVPGAFDSLIAKVIAHGDTRDEARARLVCALRDFDLVVTGGASNTGWLIDLLETPGLRAGGVDTAWLERDGPSSRAADPLAVDGLVAAAILAYQRRRRDARLNFFADTSNVTFTRVPPSGAQPIDLSYEGTSYRVGVAAMGSWRYRVQLDGRVVSATLREGDAHAAQLELGDRTLPILHDATDAGLRLEVAGRAHRFGWQTVGQVRAATPAMVVAIAVAPGDRVESGQALGVLEAMKMEIGFTAPATGVVTEVRVRAGQQVAAGDVLLVIEPESDAPAQGAGPRLALPEEADPLAGVLTTGLAGLDAAGLAALREEIRRVLLGYDVDPDRGEQLVALLAGAVSASPPRALAAIRDELVLFADVEQLFIAAPRASVSGDAGPSNAGRLRMFVRRVRAGGAGLVEEFLALVRAALAHYGIASLDHNEALERALLRLLATQQTAELRGQLVLAMVRCLTALARAGTPLGDDAALAGALRRIAAMRGLVSDTVADAAIEASDLIFEGPALERQAEEAAQRIAPWLAETTQGVPPHDVLLDLAAAPRRVFDRVGGWLDDPDPRRRGIACFAHLLRAYAPDDAVRHASLTLGGVRVECLALADGRHVAAATSAPADAARTLARMCEAVAGGRVGANRSRVDAVELLVPGGDPAGAEALVAPLAGRFPADRCTISYVLPGRDVHRTFRPVDGRLVDDADLHGVHPETAARIDLARLSTFTLERLAGADDVYCFWARSRDIADDERLLVLADVRGRSTAAGYEIGPHLAAFERSFQQATSMLRAARSARDPARRLQWNRVALFVASEVFFAPETANEMARRLAPATRHLGLETVVVRLRVRDRSRPEEPAHDVELVIADVTGARMELVTRAPDRAPLAPATGYERKVVAARRRRLLYPYEIVRMLVRGDDGATFAEYDLAPDVSPPRAVAVPDRPYGGNRSAVVFGIVTTPTEKVPEGMRRVLILSDPTRGMGALAAPECDRVLAAIDLAEEHRLPVEWAPISAGARIAMDSGTENLDATARVARRIVTFTQAGGVIHVVVHGVNVGAQSYWNALATMQNHTRGILVMTPGAAMVLTGRAALEASGSVSAEDEVALGGLERVMGPNGEAQYYASDIGAAFRTLAEHQRYTYVVPGEVGPRPHRTTDPTDRDVTVFPYPQELGHGFHTVGEIFDDRTNPGRKRPFAMRAVMQAVVDGDGGALERWRGWVGAETAIVWDAHLGGRSVCLIGIESQNVEREGYHPHDGPSSWTGGTLFPLSSKKVARALNASSGVRPVVILANLSGFDGSAESLRKLQLEYGAEIARAVVNFAGPICFLVVSRYHGGAYVVFSKALNPRMRAAALTGSYASVIGGGPAAAVVFTREVRVRAGKDPRVQQLRDALRASPTAAAREAVELAMAEAVLTAQAELAAEFDAIHSVERARAVGSLDDIVEPRAMRPYLIGTLARALG